MCALVIIAALAIYGSACGGGDGTSGPTASTLPALLPLHATRDDQPGIFDSQGRQVLLRGMNLNVLGDYFQANPDYPSVLPLKDSDFPGMARYGANVVRLILSWSSLAPVRDQISAEYLKRIHTAVDSAKASGIYVVLDMHQDAWGKYIASPPGTVCPPGREPAIGWDGAPDWATITDGKGTCRVTGVRELAPAVSQAFVNFYNDRDAIQTQLIAAWAALAREFAREPAIAGYDLLNEPHFGTGLTGTAPLLAAYSGRAVDAIRSAEQQAGGFGHIIFFEPVIVWPSPATAIAPDFTTDTNIVFAPHNYAESITAFNTLTIEQGFAQAAADAATYQSTFWIGEYGWFDDPAANKAKLIRYAREEDRLLVGGTWWQWRQACGDPHTIGTLGAQPPPQFIVFNRITCPGDIAEPVPEWAAVLSRPFPRTAPGRLLSLESDGDAGTLELTGIADGAALGANLDLWIPKRGSAAPSIAGSGLGSIRLVEVAGGYRALIAVSGNYQVTVTSH